MKPFGAGGSLSIGGLTIETDPDRVTIYGSGAIERSNEGLKVALALKDVVDQAVKALESDGALADALTDHPTERVANPFNAAG